MATLKDVSFWRKTWYPIVFSSELSRTEPYGIQILGDPVVLWRDPNGKANCVADRCPHRSAPLSLGTIRNGKLECKYHGWQFSTGGECTLIPSMPSTKSIGKAFCAYDYPTVEKWGFVWVWVGPKELADERLIPDHLFREFADPTNWATNWGSRDLEIDHGLMIENLLDPAHLPFTHEGTLAKRTDATVADFTLLYDNLSTPLVDLEDEELAPFSSDSRDWVQIEEQESDTRAKGFRGVQGRYVQPNRPEKSHQYFTFQAPYVTRLDLYLSKAPSDSKKYKGRSKLIQVHFNIPVTPTKLRFNYLFIRNIGVTLNKIPGFNRYFVWQSDLIINQDVEMLGGQQIYLLNGAKPWNTAVNADKVGVKYRRWREKEEARKDPWFVGFQQQTTAVDIEDLVASAKTESTNAVGLKSKNPVKSEERLPSMHVQNLYRWTLSSDGSKFKPRHRYPLIDPALYKPFSLAVIVLIISVVLRFFAYV